MKPAPNRSPKWLRALLRKFYKTDHPFSAASVANGPARRFNLPALCLATVLVLGVAIALLFWSSIFPASAQTAERAIQKKDAAPSPNLPTGPAKENTPPPTPPADAVAVPAAPPPIQPEPPPGPGAIPARGGPGQIDTDLSPSTEEIQLSFQGANIEMIVQWLAKATGKSVVKHPKVQCQLTIVSSKKQSRREAINLVYRALALEGFTTIESSKSILIVPEGQEPKMSPELLNGASNMPEGRQRLLKIFTLKNIQAGEIREKIRAVLSDKASIDVADRANQLLVTDYTDNIALAGELIKELDVASGGDSVIEFFPLKHSEAEELGALLTLVLNAQPAPPPSATPSRSSSSSSRTSSSMSSPSPFGGPPQPVVTSEPPPPSPAPSAAGGSQTAAQVRIWPDKISNRLIVAAPKGKIPEVKRLIDLLDTEKPQDVSIRVLQLKNVSAEDLVKDLGPLYQKMSGKSAKDIIEVSSNSRANSLVILSSESNFKAIEKLVAALDTEEAQEKTLRDFPLKNADAEDVAKQLQDLNQDQTSGRYPFYYFSYSSMNQTSKKPTFVADRRRNTVIAQAPPAAMESIAKMIEDLDQPISDDSLAPRIFRLKYVSAADIEDVLNELFLKKQQTRNYWDLYGMPAQDSGDRQNAGRLYGKVRITSEPYANAIIVTANSPENLSAVEDVLKQLDVPSQAGETTLRLGLRFAKASVVANSLNILFARNGSPPLRQINQPGQQNQQNPLQQQQSQNNSYQGGFALEQETKEEGYYPWLGGQQDNLRGPDGRSAIRPVSDLVGRVRVVADERSNSLLISANAHFFTQIIKLIEDLDAPTAQVLIEAKIVEVSRDFLEKLGVRWSPDGSQTFTADDLDNSVIARVRGEHVKEFGGASAAIARSMHSGFLDTTISLDFLVQFLRKTTDATVLSEPQVNIADNELGKLFVGQQVPILNNQVNPALGGTSVSFSYRDVGVILEVTPHINTSGDVALKIRAESSSVVPGQLILGGAVFDTRNFKTDITAKNGQTLVLGGIIQKQLSDTLRKTPFLGDIPGLGWLFKKKDKLSREVELLVFLRPKVVRSPEEAKELLEEMDKKAPLIRKWKDESDATKEIKDRGK